MKRDAVADVEASEFEACLHLAIENLDRLSGDLRDVVDVEAILRRCCVKRVVDLTFFVTLVDVYSF